MANQQCIIVNRLWQNVGDKTQKGIPISETPLPPHAMGKTYIS